VAQQKKANPHNLDIVNERREVLREKIDSYERLRSRYMPGLWQYMAESGADLAGSASEQTRIEDVSLWLPSEIDRSRRENICVAGLVDLEDRLRTARCHDALQNIQHSLRVKSRMFHFKKQNIRGQRDNMRSRAVIDRVAERMKGFMRKYRHSREAKVKLLGPGAWENVLRVLRDEDVRSYHDQALDKKRPGRQGANEDSWEPAEQYPEANDREPGVDLRTDVRLGIDEHPSRKAGEAAPRWTGTGEGRKLLSWIWTGIPTSIEDGADEGNEILRAEWCRSRARMKHALEEVRLVKQEMDRTIESLRKRDDWWQSRTENRGVEDPRLQEGL